MIERIVERLTDRGCLVDPTAAAHIAQQPQPDAYVDRVLSGLEEMPIVLTLDALRAAEADLMPSPSPLATAATSLAELMPRPAAAALAVEDPTRAVLSAHNGPLAAEYDAEVRVLKDASTSKPTAGDVRDFVRYFNDRFEHLTKLLRQRREVANSVRIRDVAHAGREVQVIGLVKEKSRHNQGSRFLTLEDDTGTIDVLFPGQKPELQGAFDSLLPDEVVGLVAKPAKNGGLLVADALIRPDLPYTGDRPRADAPLYAAFLGDVHVGSKTFLKGPFQHLLRWLHGKEGGQRERAIAQSIKYLVFPGDLVDGVGVYPGQQEALEIEDVTKQYEALAAAMDEIPKHQHLVFLPGNHDAARPNEPQPALAKELRSLFDRHEVTFVSNPSAVSLHGIHTLAYHGYSMIDFATSVPGMRMDQPIPVMKQMLQCRHVAPTYGGKTPISPEERDYLLIDQVPDIFVTGHVHVAAMDRYKDVTLVNGGTWQAQTDYQKMQNLIPTPARLPVVNLSNLRGTMIDFSVS